MFRPAQAYQHQNEIIYSRINPLYNIQQTRNVISICQKDSHFTVYFESINPQSRQYVIHCLDLTSYLLAINQPTLFAAATATPLISVAPLPLHGQMATEESLANIVAIYQTRHTFHVSLPESIALHYALNSLHNRAITPNSVEQLIDAAIKTVIPTFQLSLDKIMPRNCAIM